MSGRRSHSSVNGDKQQINLQLNCNQYPIIGIHLGISYWSAAVVQDGKVLVIPFSGNKNMPAFVACLNNEFKFGNEAKRMFFDNPEVTIFDIIYILGLHFNSGGEVEEHMNDYSYAISNFSDKPKLSFANKKADIYIEELFDLIINNLIYTSEIFLNKTVHNIVIPVPVYFKESQKSTLLRATTHVNIIELILEPIATAYAYRIHEKYEDDTKDRYFLVYNLHEDNLDVSVVHYANNKFNIKSNIYERHLKRNYTFRFLDELCTQTYETYFISNPRFHPLNSGTLRYYCKAIFEDILHADCFKIKMDTVREEKIVQTISRTELDELLRVLVQESLVSIQDVLREAKLETRDIDEVLLVGKVTRHTIVRQQLKYLFGRHSLNCSLNPEDVLVIGAALRADILQRKKLDNDIRIRTPKPNVCCEVFDTSTYSMVSAEKSCFRKTQETYQQNFTKETTKSFGASSICFEAEDFQRKLSHGKKIKPKSVRNDFIKKRKTKLSLREKMLSMCSLFTDVVNGSNLKLSVKEKLLFVPSYLRNKLICRSKSIKKSYDFVEEKDLRDLRLVHKYPTENIPSKRNANCTKLTDKFQETTMNQCNQQKILKKYQHPNKSLQVTRTLIVQKNNSIFNGIDLTKPKIQKEYLQKSCKLISDSCDEKFYNGPSSEYVAEATEERYENKTKWSLLDRVNCVKDHLDMFYVTVCIVVFVLHWASENICINVAIALISIAITLILNNRASIERFSNENNLH